MGEVKDRGLKNLTNVFSTILIVIYFFLFLVSNIVPPFANIYSSYSAAIEFVVIALLFFLNIKHILKDKKLFLVLLLTLSLAALSILITGGGFGSFLNLSKFLMGTLIFSTISISDKGQKRLYVLCLILWIYYLIMSTQIWDLYQKGASLVNPNTVGVMLFSTSIVATQLINGRRRKRILMVLLYTITLTAIVSSQCRSAIVAMVLFLLLSYVPFLKLIILRTKSFIMSSLAIIDFVFTKLYASQSFSNESLTTLISYTNKSVYSGRDKLWSKMFSQLDADGINYLTGLGTKYGASEGEIYTNFHNWYFGIVYSFGVPVCLLYFYIFIKSVGKITSYTFLCGIIALMIIGFFEMIGQGGVSVCVFIYLLLGRNNK